MTLSAHELATLFRLRTASVLTDVETPDVVALQEAGVVQVIILEDGDAALKLTVDGKVLLRMLGAEPVGNRSTQTNAPDGPVSCAVWSSAGQHHQAVAPCSCSRRVGCLM